MRGQNAQFSPQQTRGRAASVRRPRRGSLSSIQRQNIEEIAIIDDDDVDTQAYLPNPTVNQELPLLLPDTPSRPSGPLSFANIENICTLEDEEEDVQIPNIPLQQDITFTSDPEVFPYDSSQDPECEEFVDTADYSNEDFSNHAQDVIIEDTYSLAAQPGSSQNFGESDRNLSRLPPDILVRKVVEDDDIVELD